MEAVKKLIDQGKARYAGICNYSVENMEQTGIKISSSKMPQLLN